MTEPLRVLVADDEHDVRLLLRIQLEAFDEFECVGEAFDGQDCLERCDALRPDLVVLDLLMPKMDGFAAISELQRRHPSIGIVAYTGVAGEFVRSEMDRLGIELVLKSGDVSRLAEALRHAAKGRRLPRSQ